MARKSAQKKKLEEELSALIPLLDEEGLSFLIRQANVHLYNMEVDRLNAEMEKSARPKPASKAASAGAKKATSKAASATKKKEAKASSAQGQPSFSIQHSPAASCYHIAFAGGDWKLFTQGEMDKLVRLAKSKESAAGTRRACFAWLKAERADALSDWGISSADDETLKAFISFLNSKFSIRRS